MDRRRTHEPREAVDGQRGAEQLLQFGRREPPLGGRDEVDGLRRAGREANPLVVPGEEARAFEPCAERADVLVPNEEVEVAARTGKRAEDEHRPGSGVVNDARSIAWLDLLELHRPCIGHAATRA